MKKVIVSLIAIAMSIPTFAQVHKSSQSVKNGLGEKVNITMTILSEPSEGAFLDGFKSQYTDLICCGETLEGVSQDVLINRIATSASTAAKYGCSVKASWEPKELVFMWNEDMGKYFGTFKGYASNAYGVKEEVKIIMYIETNGDVHR